jgi:putative ABC transport system substrate-binding protein
MPVIGFVHGASADGFASPVAAFRRGLAEGGFSENRNVTIEYRWLEGRYENAAEKIGELVRRPVDLLFTGGSPAPTQAAKTATKTIPVVFTIGRDPVRLGLVQSLNRPGGNLTGVYLFVASMESKRLGLLREMIPQAALIAVLLNPTTENSDGQLKDVQQAAQSLGLQIRVVHARTAQEIDMAFTAAKQAGAKAMLFGADAFLDSRYPQIVSLSARHAMPAIFSQREHAVAGGLMSYGTERSDGYRQAGLYVGRIFKGEKPADLPVLQSTKFEFVLNLKTARTLGLDVPPSLSARADEVIE